MTNGSLRHFIPHLHSWKELASELSDLPSETEAPPLEQSAMLVQQEEDRMVCEILEKAGFHPYENLHGKVTKAGELNGHLENVPMYKNWSIIPSILKRQQKSQRDSLLAFGQWILREDPEAELHMLTVSLRPPVKLCDISEAVDELKEGIRTLPKLVIGETVKVQASQIDFKASGLGKLNDIRFFAHNHSLVRINRKEGQSLQGVEADISKHFKASSHASIEMSDKIRSWEDLKRTIDYVAKPSNVITHLLENCPDAIVPWHEYRSNAQSPRKTRSLEFFTVYGSCRKFRAELKKMNVSIKVTWNQKIQRIDYYRPSKREQNLNQDTATSEDDTDAPDTRRNVLLTGPSLPHKFGDKVTVTRLFLNLTTLHEAYYENEILPFVSEGMLLLVRKDITLHRRISTLDEEESFDEKWNILTGTGWFPWMKKISKVECWLHSLSAA